MGNDVNDIGGAAAQGIVSLFNIDPLTTVLVLIILALIWLVRYLIQRNERQNDKVTDALLDNTAIISEFKEMIRALMAQKS